MQWFESNAPVWCDRTRTRISPYHRSSIVVWRLLVSVDSRDLTILTYVGVCLAVNHRNRELPTTFEWLRFAKSTDRTNFKANLKDANKKNSKRERTPPPTSIDGIELTLTLFHFSSLCLVSFRYPGHMHAAKQALLDRVSKCHLVLEVRDARVREINKTNTKMKTMRHMLNMRNCVCHFLCVPFSFF